MKFSIIILFFFLITSSNSNELVDIVDLENEVILLRFTEQFDYNTYLSEDKKNLTIEIQNTNSNYESNNFKIRSELQKEIFVTNNNVSIKLNLLHNSPVGFNTYKLPYSNSLIIESFAWSEITNSEELYRDGLFAYESKLYDVAVFNLQSSNIQKSDAMLGLIYLLQDSVVMSYEQLISAARNNSYLPDVYAALSQIHLQNGDTTKANYFNQRFLEKLNISDSSFSYPTLIFNTNELNLDDYAEVVDSSEIKSNKNVNTKNRFTNLFDTNNLDDKSKIESKNENLIGNNSVELQSFIIYLFVGIVLLLLFVFAYYLKWRNSKLKQTNNLAKSDFEKKLKQEKDKHVSEPIVYNKVIGLKNEKVNNKKETTKFNIESDTNFKIEDLEQKIRLREKLDSIKFDSRSNINISTLKSMNEASKSKLFRKYNVTNRKNK